MSDGFGLLGIAVVLVGFNVVLGVIASYLERIAIALERRNK